MGQFSWKTQDTDVQIFNDWDIHGDQQTIHMVDPRDGTDYVETAYEGYGVFGGRDFYELLAELNNVVPVFSNWKDLTEDQIRDRRSKGITLWFDYLLNNQPKSDGKFVVSPILVENYDTWHRYTNPGDHPEDDPDQGWHVEDGY